MKSKIAAGIFGIFLGGIGVHKFYLGEWAWGIIYILFFWTYIPTIVGFIEGIIYLTTPDKEFNLKFNPTVIDIPENEDRRTEKDTE